MATSNSQAFETHPLGINIHPSGTSIFHSTTSSSLQLVQPISKLVPVKHEDGNFLTWKQKILFAIRGYGLEDYITKDSNIIPPQFITDESGIQIHKRSSTPRSVTNILAPILHQFRYSTSPCWI